MAESAAFEPLEVLYEAAGLPRAAPFPDELARLSGGAFGLADECLYANFVATLDGVVAIPGMGNSNAFVAAESDADRFLMGVLRTLADVVLLGAGVLGASPRGSWRPEQIYPPAGEAYAELRRALGVPEAPEIAVLTGSGSVDSGHPLFASGALVLTSEAGAARLAGRLPSASTTLVLGDSERLEPKRVVEALRERGHGRILSEAGPHTFGRLLDAGLVDELFLTASPLLVGDAGPGSRLRLVEAADLVERPGLRLLSVRRHGSHLFQRYEL